MVVILDTLDSTNGTTISESVVPPSLQFTFGVAGNVVALALLIRTSKVHKWRPFYRLVGGLAITDLSSILFVYPAVMVRYASGFTYNFSKELCSYVSFMFSFCFLSSAMIITTMSVERFFAVVFPFRYASRDRGKQACLALLAVWVTSGFICSLNFFGVGSVRLYYPGSWCFLNFVSTNMYDKVDSIIYCTVGIILLLTTFAMNSSVIFYILRQSLFGQINSAKTNGHNKGTKSEALAYTVVLLFLVVIIFMVCWIPLMVRILINLAMETKNESMDLVAIRLTISNAIVDPWVYILVRRNVCQMLAKKAKCTTLTSQTGTTSPSGSKAENNTPSKDAVLSNSKN